MHPQDDSTFRFSIRERKVKTVNFNVGKINWLPWQRPLDYYETYDSFLIPIHVTTYAERLTKIGLVVTEIFKSDMPIFAVSSNKVQLLPSQSLGLLDRMSPKLYTM